MRSTQQLVKLLLRGLGCSLAGELTWVQIQQQRCQRQHQFHREAAGNHRSTKGKSHRRVPVAGSSSSPSSSSSLNHIRL